MVSDAGRHGKLHFLFSSCIAALQTREAAAMTQIPFERIPYLIVYDEELSLIHI